jgi:hypothetical protein
MLRVWIDQGNYQDYPVGNGSQVIIPVADLGAGRHALYVTLSEQHVGAQSGAFNLHAQVLASTAAAPKPELNQPIANVPTPQSMYLQERGTTASYYAALAMSAAAAQWLVKLLERLLRKLIEALQALWKLLFNRKALKPGELLSAIGTLVGVGVLSAAVLLAAGSAAWTALGLFAVPVALGVWYRRFEDGPGPVQDGWLDVMPEDGVGGAVNAARTALRNV